MAKEKRLIDANEAQVVLENIAKRMLEAENIVTAVAVKYAAEVIGRQKTVDAAPVVHGQWVGIQYDGYADGCPVYDLWKCSNCREEYETDGDAPPFTYCPSCGAKMDERSVE